MIKLPEVEIDSKYKKQPEKKTHITYSEKTVANDFSPETVQGRRQWKDIFS